MMTHLIAALLLAWHGLKLVAVGLFGIVARTVLAGIRIKHAVLDSTPPPDDLLHETYNTLFNTLILMLCLVAWATF